MAKPLLTKEQADFVIKNYIGITIDEITEKLNKEFGCDFTVDQIAGWKKRKKLVGSKKKRPESKLFPKEVQQYIREIAVGRYKSEITEMVNAKFGTSYTVGQIRSWVKYKKINTGLTGHFEKGKPSPRKGVKIIQTEAMKKTQFHKGDMPHNMLKVGDKVITEDGYIRIKVADPDKWEFLHRIIWEEHNGPIPPGMKIIFLDNDKTNCDISNLAMINNVEHGFLMSHKLRFDRAEATEAAVLLSKIYSKGKRRKNEKGKV